MNATGQFLSKLEAGRLALPMGIHFTWNYFQGPVFGFAVSGTTMQGSLLTISDHGPQWFTGGIFGPEAGVSGLIALLIGIVALLAFRWNPDSPPFALAERARQLVSFNPRIHETDSLNEARQSPVQTNSMTT